jgi:hypothetical protein
VLVTSLEKMEEIVRSSSNLKWIGWDVVKHTPSNNAMFVKNGAIIDGVWSEVNTFPATEHGWEIPNSIGSKYEKLEG